ncbi:Tyrosine recombinase XerC [Methylorubrum suomiense]|uniref:Tyrosine recombinase XerC n=2 Tax=Methylorubrum suomiense TaxID=144191 RepID=A0ABQ4V0V8_9HYPH|nr:Tyrosine recombinase XerC [Methylorubrum suomiense]
MVEHRLRKNGWLSMHVRLKGVKRVRKRLADGTIRLYHYDRATMTPIAGTPGTSEFAASQAEAGRAKAQTRSAGTVEWLIRQYRQSGVWKRLAASTREIGNLNLKAVEEKWGAMPIEALTIVPRPGVPSARTLLLDWHEGLAETHPRAADAKLSAFNGVLAWAVDKGHIPRNPIGTFTRAYRANRADLIWLPENIASFESVASPKMHLAMMLALHTGQRQGDLLTLPWSAYDGEAITLRQGKTRKLVYVPTTAALQVALASAPRRSPTILTMASGRPWLKRHFHTIWTETVKAAGIADDLHFHDLRGTAVTMLAEAGCTVPEIATITGHSQAHAQKILDRYLARTRTRTLARSAIAKLEDHRRTRQMETKTETGA